MVSVDTVYQRVLAIANKEQRGYVTPQEFNLIANQAQSEIFEDYFTQMNVAKQAPGNESEYSDVIKTRFFYTLPICISSVRFGIRTTTCWKME